MTLVLNGAGGDEPSDEDNNNEEPGDRPSSKSIATKPTGAAGATDKPAGAKAAARPAASKAAASATPEYGSSIHPSLCLYKILIRKARERACKWNDFLKQFKLLIKPNTAAASCSALPSVLFLATSDPTLPLSFQFSGQTLASKEFQNLQDAVAGMMWILKCARDDDGHLKDASEIEFYNSESDEKALPAVSNEGPIRHALVRDRQTAPSKYGTV
ncbi:hypothetical protein B0H14DRAFT_3489182 [Mycena olivaceomarginata]|nr:hypothetical protein B0H14DRAFT_3489182 [Mycena olivaceomarginata]